MCDSVCLRFFFFFAHSQGPRRKARQTVCITIDTGISYRVCHTRKHLRNSSMQTRNIQLGLWEIVLGTPQRAPQDQVAAVLWGMAPVASSASKSNLTQRACSTWTCVSTSATLTRGGATAGGASGRRGRHPGAARHSRSRPGAARTAARRCARPRSSRRRPRSCGRPSSGRPPAQG